MYRTPTRPRLPLLCCLMLLAACRADINDPACEGSGGAIDGGWIGLWEGHSYSWQDLSHRIAFLRAGVSMPAADGAMTAELGILGGSWADGRHYRDHPSYTLGHSRVRADDLVAWYDEVPLPIGPDGRASATIEVDLNALDLPRRQQWAIALTGICIDTDVPFLSGYDGSYSGDEGWTPRGFGARLSPVALAEKGGAVSFVASVHFSPGRLDRVHHNEALEFAQIETVISYALLGFDQGAVEPGLLEASAFYGSEGEVHSDIPRIPASERRLQLRGQPGLPSGLPLLRGFDFEFNANTGDDKPGRYLREWAAQIEEFSYDQTTGTADLLIDGYASHSSTIQEGDLEVEFSATVDLLQLADPQTEILRSRVADDQSILGSWSHDIAAR